MSATRPGRRTAATCSRVHVADTEEKALKNARQFMWMQGEFTGLAHPVWASPSGYFSPSEHRRGFVEFAAGRGEQPARPADLRGADREHHDHRRHPEDQVIAKLRHVMEADAARASWRSGRNDGTVSHEDTRTCIRLLGQEVMPAMREIGKELGLNSPFEADAPVSIDYSRDLARAAAE